MIRMVVLIMSVLFSTKGDNDVIYRLNESDYNRMPPIYGLDSYTECLKNNGKYVYAKYVLYADEDNELLNMIQNYSKYRAIHFNHSVIDQGLCTTTSCKQYIRENDGMDLKVILEECLSERIHKEYGLRVKLLDSIDTHETLRKYSSKDYIDWLFIFIIVIIISLNIVGSIYDVKYVKSKGIKDSKKINEYLRNFSIFSNWNSLVAPYSKDATADRTHFLNGTRMFLSFNVVFAHVMTLEANVIDNPHAFEEAYYGPSFLLKNGLTFVQPYIAVCGALLVYNMRLKYGSKEITWTLIPTLVLRRLARLVPTYYLVFFFTTTWLRHLGSGPVWDHYITYMSVEQCRPFWLHHLLLLNNNFYENRCFVPFWYVAAETQLYILGLAVYIGTNTKWMRRALGLLLIIGILSPVLQMVIHGRDATVIFTPETLRAQENENLFGVHVKTHVNLAGFIVGLAGGVVCYHLYENNVYYKHSKVLASLELLISVGFYSVIQTGLIVTEPTTHIVWKLLYAALQRVLIAFLGCILAILMFVKAGYILRPIFELSFWRVPARLSYCVYLIHILIIYAILGSREKLHHTSTSSFFANHFISFALSYLIALPLHLLVESPMRRLLYLFIDKKKTMSDEKKEK